MSPRLPILVLALAASCSGSGGGQSAPPSGPPGPAPPTLREPVEVEPTGPALALALAPGVSVDLVNTYVDPETSQLTGSPTGTATVQIMLSQVPGDSVSVTVEFSTDGGASFAPATIDEDTSALSPPASPTGASTPTAEPVITQYTVTWQLAADLGPGQFGMGSVEVRVVPDGATPGPIQAAPFEVDLEGFPFPSSTALLAARTGHAALVLPDDSLLVVAGRGVASVLSSAELGARSDAFADFDFAPAGDLSVARADLAQARDLDGKLWLTGGQDEIGPRAEVDVFDPVTGAFSSRPPLNFARAGHAMLKLPNGRLIVIGGRSDAAGGPPAGDSYEVFDEVSGAWQVGALTGTYSEPLAVLLSDGRVLITGPAPGLDTPQAEYLTLGDNNQLSSSPAVLPAASRRAGTATVLVSGEVLLFGGHDLTGSASTPVAELLNPSAGSLGTITALTSGNELLPAYSIAGRWGHSASLTGAGRLLIMGGQDASSAALDRIDSYLPKSGTFWPASPLPTPRTEHRTSRLQAGQLVVSGGLDVDASPLGTTITLTSPDGPDQLPSATLELLTWAPPLALVTIDYTLFDAESNPARIRIEWTTRPNEPESWRPATAKTLFGIPFGDGFVNLETSPTGVAHSFGWDATADNIFAQGSPKEFFVRFTPIAAADGTPVEFSQILP